MINTTSTEKATGLLIYDDAIKEFNLTLKIHKYKKIKKTKS